MELSDKAKALLNCMYSEDPGKHYSELKYAFNKDVEEAALDPLEFTNALVQVAEHHNEPLNKLLIVVGALHKELAKSKAKKSAEYQIAFDNLVKCLKEIYTIKIRPDKA